MSNTPETTPNKKRPSFRSAVSGVMKRQSFGLKRSGSKSSLSDSTSSVNKDATKESPSARTSKESTRPIQVRTKSLAPPVNDLKAAVSPVAESPMREAAAMMPTPIVKPSPLAAIPSEAERTAEEARPEPQPEPQPEPAHVPTPAPAEPVVVPAAVEVPPTSQAPPTPPLEPSEPKAVATETHVPVAAEHLTAEPDEMSLHQSSAETEVAPQPQVMPQPEPEPEIPIPTFVPTDTPLPSHIPTVIPTVISEYIPPVVSTGFESATRAFGIQINPADKPSAEPTPHHRASSDADNEDSEVDYHATKQKPQVHVSVAPPASVQHPSTTSVTETFHTVPATPFPPPTIIQDSHSHQSYGSISRGNSNDQPHGYAADYYDGSRDSEDSSYGAENGGSGFHEHKDKDAHGVISRGDSHDAYSDSDIHNHHHHIPDMILSPVDGPQPRHVPEDAHVHRPGSYNISAPQVAMPMPSISDVMTTSRGLPTENANNENQPLMGGMPTPRHYTKRSSSATIGRWNYASTSSANAHSSSLGWNHITLPDTTVYFVHPQLQVVTDVDLREAHKLEAVVEYLQNGSLAEGLRPPEGWELWIVEGTVGKPKKGKKSKENVRLLRSWVNHTERGMSFEHPRAVDNGDSSSNGEDRLDMEYRYWAFMETHPAHAPLPNNAREEALDALTWSYTDCLLPGARPIPPPFAQDECQELMTLLRSLGSEQDSTSQQVVHTRIVSRILMRLAQWRQHYYRPNKPLPTDMVKKFQMPRATFFQGVQNFLVSTLCLGLPYLFINRVHSGRLLDEESGLRSAGPMLAIGACSCIIAAIILSASVTLVSIPGLDNYGRIAGFVAILCSTASMFSAIIALFRYKADQERERAVVYIGGEGLVMLSRRSIAMSLPLVFLAWAIAAFIAAITLYSFRGVITSPGEIKIHFDEYTHWIVVGVLGGLTGVLITSTLLLRR